MLFPGITNCGKIEAFYPRKIKGTIQDVYAHARNLHVATINLGRRRDNNYFINIEFLKLL